MITIRTIAAACLAWAALCGTAAAQAPRASDLVKAELLAEPDAVSPGTAFTVGVRLRMREHWHTYWRNPGDSGLGTTIAWTLPEGFTAGPIVWPTPERIPVGPLVNFGYEREVVLLTEITPPARAAAGLVKIKADVAYLVCEKICIPGDAKVALTLPAAVPGAAGANVAEFALFRERMPAPAPWSSRLAVEGDTLRLKLDAPKLSGGAIRDAYLFPFDETVVEHAAPQRVSVDGAGLTLELKRSALSTAPPARLDGVLVLEEALEGGTTRHAFTLGDPASGLVASSGGGVPAKPLDLSLAAILQAAGLAFLGGLLLNLMPCVFPVLSIKVLSLVKHSGLTPGLVRLNGLAYAAGVVATFLALAALLLALRAGGAEMGWGYQLQSPVVVGAIAFLLFAMGLSLSGVAEFGTSLGSFGSAGGRSGLGGSFSTGILATIVATPCTAPFMGAAVGYAVTAPAAVALAVFAALGLGLALPFLVLTFSPGLVGRLPRPGAWMATLKQILAFPIYATVAWLVFVLAQQVGPSGLFAALMGLVLVGLGVWAYGLSAGGSGWGRRVAQATAFASVVGLAGIAYALHADRGPVAGAGGIVQTAGDGTEPFTQARLDGLRGEGRPVFLNLTAAWCITCLVNERTTLSTEPVREAFRARRITYLKGDWTNRNPEITRLLERHGRSGVPLYVLYPERGEPVILPQILTEATVLESLAKVGETKRADLQQSPSRSPKE